MNMVLNIRGGQINFAHTNFNILIDQYLFSSAVKALSGSQCHGNSYECYFLFWLTNISCTWHFGPIFLALDDDDGDSKCEDDEAARVSSL